MKRPVIYIMGVSGSGKTIIGQKLSASTGIPFFDADDYHSVANKEKMRTALPLTDEDRKEWLLAINQLAKKESTKQGAIIACSALKEKYRQLLSQEIDSPVHWIFLHGDYQLIRDRILARRDHFMPVGLLGSQFEILEAPSNAISIDITKNPDEIVEEIGKKLDII